MKIIKISTEFEMTIHDFPEGTMREQNKVLCELIGNGCDIVEHVIPHITDTANNILGSMTGGTMGVEFVMERTVKGKDGDRATLDVLINEYGRTTLPYGLHWRVL